MKNPKWIVKKVKANKDYTLLITFANGKQKIYNALPLLEKSIYAPLKNINFFLNAKALCGTVIWDDSIDIAPEHLYDCSISVKNKSERTL